MTTSHEAIVGLGRVYAKCDDCDLDNLDWFETCDVCEDTLCIFCHEACIECRTPMCWNCCGEDWVPALDNGGIDYGPIYICKRRTCEIAFGKKLDTFEVDQWLYLLSDRGIYVHEEDYSDDEVDYYSQ